VTRNSTVNVSTRSDLAPEVQAALLRLMAWNGRQQLTDHGYDVTADLDTLLGQFTFRVDRSPVTQHNEV